MLHTKEKSKMIAKKIKRALFWQRFFVFHARIKNHFAIVREKNR